MSFPVSSLPEGSALQLRASGIQTDMNFPKVQKLSARLWRVSTVFALLGLVALPARLDAQCTAAGTPVQFEPNPPGASRPGTLSAGFSNSLAVYRNLSGSPRLLMIEAWGYSTLDLTNPLTPMALRYDDLRLDPNSGGTNKVQANGDGQSYIQTIGVSADGQRIVSSVNGPAEPTWHNLVGRPDGDGFGMWGDFGDSRASGTVVQHGAGALRVVRDVLLEQHDRVGRHDAHDGERRIRVPEPRVGGDEPAAGLRALDGGQLRPLPADVGHGHPDHRRLVPRSGRQHRVRLQDDDAHERAGRSVRAAPEELRGRGRPADPTKLWVLVELGQWAAGGRELAELRSRLDQPERRRRQLPGARLGRRDLPRALVRRARRGASRAAAPLSSRATASSSRSCGRRAGFRRSSSSSTPPRCSRGPPRPPRCRFPRASASRRRARACSRAPATASTSTCPRGRARSPSPSRASR